MFGILGGMKWYLVAFTLTGNVATFHAEEYKSEKACLEAAASKPQPTDGSRFGYSCMSEKDQKNMLEYNQAVVFQIAQ